MIVCGLAAGDSAATTRALLALLRAASAGGAPTLLVQTDPATVGRVAALIGVARVRTAQDLAPHWSRLHGAALQGYLAAGTHAYGILEWPVLGSAAPAAVAQAYEIIERLRATYTHIVIDAGAQPTWVAGTWWRVAERCACVAPATTAGLASLRRTHGWLADAVVPRARWADLLVDWDPVGELSAAMLHDVADGVAQWRIAAHDDADAAIGALWSDLQAAPLKDLPTPAVERIWKELTPPSETTATSLATDTSAPVVDPSCVAQVHAAIPWNQLPAQTDRAAREVWLDAQLAHGLTQHPEWCPAQLPVATWMQYLRDELLGFGPLEAILADPHVTEVMVNGPTSVWIERAGRLQTTTTRFHSMEHLRHIVDRIVLPSGRRVDESVPIVDTRLPDGSRVHVVMPPVALLGPTITIRRFRRQGWTLDDLVEARALPAALAVQLADAVRRRRSLLVIGGTGSGKTTLLNALAGAMLPGERIITIEDAAELQLPQPHVVRLEARPANIEGHGAISIRELVRAALRMRPDRIIVGECRGAEALDMLQAMNTGHEGSMTTLHANAPDEAIHRLATLVCFAGLDLPLRAIHQQIASAVHVIVAVGRCADGRRIVRSVADVVGVQQGEVQLQTWYRATDAGAEDAC